MGKSFSHQELCRESNLSFALLKEILSDDEVTRHSDVVYFYGIPFKDVDEKILLVYSYDSIKLRRKNKGKYVYFNIFRNHNHFEFLLDKLYSHNDEIDHIEVEDLQKGTDWYSVKIKNIHNKVMNEIRVFNTEEFNKQRSIIRLLMNYYNII